MLILTDAGARGMLSSLNNMALSLHLFVNDFWPENHHMISDFIEAAGGDYKPIVLTDGMWTIDQEGPAVASYNPQTFTFAGPLNKAVAVHGYFVLAGGWVLVWAERFNKPFTPANSGDKIKVTLKMGLRGAD